MKINNFLKSYFKSVNSQGLLDSMQQYKKLTEVSVSKVDFDKLQKWSINSDGDFVHDSGKFFSICGAKAINKKTGKETFQPIINQPEQGILGITTRYKNDCLELLLQSKIEPGNLNSVQYSPTVQATKSNYTKAHKGNSVPYIDDFMPSSSKVMSRGFQSEHGYKFYGKANDNVHVHDNNVEILDDRFAWLSLNDVRYLLSNQHLINMDTRSVLSTIDFIGRSVSYDEIFTQLDYNGTLIHDLLYSSLSDGAAKHSTEDIRSWLAYHKRNSVIDSCTMPLNLLFNKGWNMSKDNLSSQKNKHFELVGVQASIKSREVSSWHQPIVKDNVPKTYVFLLKKINNILHVCVQIVEEDYNWSGPEIGPTFHSIQSKAELYAKLLANGLSYKKCKIVYDKYQSEEGGRFFEQKNRYMLILVNEDVRLNMSDKFRWLTLYQLKSMTSLECSVNIEARTLLSIASYYKGGPLVN